MLFMIEYLEPAISRWLYLEYEHSSKIVGRDRLIFTNIKRSEDAKILSNLSIVRSESIIEIFDQEKIVILDPKAKEKIKPEDLRGKEVIVIGGILGDHPPPWEDEKTNNATGP